MPIIFKHRGDFRKTDTFFKRLLKRDILHILEKYGREGVTALEQATPVRTGLTARSWNYAVSKTFSGYSLSWYNTNMAGDTPIVILLQYGHGTRGGSYIQGKDFINPAMKPIFQNIADKLWKEVTGL